MNEVVMHPCPLDIEKACAQFDAENEVLEAALGELFRQFPRNADPAHVFLKVTALNALYGTQIPVYSARIPSLLEVAHHIVGLTVDSALDRGSEELVGKIASVVVANKAVRFNYSFATKYCSWQRPNMYPIFDSRVSEYLWNLRKQGYLGRFHRDDLWDYAKLKKIVIEFRDKFGLEGFTFKQIDKFLYLQGGSLLSQKYGSTSGGEAEPENLSSDEENQEADLPPERFGSTEEYLLAHGYTPDQVANSKNKHTDWQGWIAGGQAIGDTK